MGVSGHSFDVSLVLRPSLIRYPLPSQAAAAARNAVTAIGGG